MNRTMLASWILSTLFHLVPAWAMGEKPPTPRPDDLDRNAQGLWWASPAGAESGWGLNITHQGNSLFVTWFTYDTDGRPVWYVITGTHRLKYSGGGFTNVHQGTLYRATGPFFAEPWNSSKVQLTPVGGAYLWLDSTDNGTFQPWFSTGPGGPPPGGSETKRITRYAFSSPAPTCVTDGEQGEGYGDPPNYTDMWWSAPAQSEAGWGVNIAHQGDTLFATWFTFGHDGKADWVVMSNGERQLDGSYSGMLYRMSGPAYGARPWDSSQVKAYPAGHASFAFNDEDNGTFSYSLDGISQSKPITRYVYATPGTVCQ
jgi:hypothetical protein